MTTAIVAVNYSRNFGFDFGEQEFRPLGLASLRVHSAAGVMAGVVEYCSRRS